MTAFQPGWTIEYGQIVERNRHALPAALDGPWLFVGQILKTLTSTPARLKHVCVRCVSKGIPATIERLTTGIMCEVPTCTGDGQSACYCCRSMFCQKHLSPMSALKVLVKYESERNKNASQGQWPVPAPFCQLCRLEKESQARLAAERACRRNGMGSPHINQCTVASGLYSLNATVYRKYAPAIRQWFVDIDMSSSAKISQNEVFNELMYWLHPNLDCPRAKLWHEDQTFRPNSFYVKLHRPGH